MQKIIINHNLLVKNLTVVFIFFAGILLFLTLSSPVEARGLASGCCRMGEIDNNGTINLTDRDAIIYILMASLPNRTVDSNAEGLVWGASVFGYCVVTATARHRVG